MSKPDGFAAVPFTTTKMPDAGQYKDNHWKMVTDYCAEADALVITDQESYDLAGTVGSKIHGYLKSIEKNMRGKIIDLQYQAYKNSLSLMQELMKPLEARKVLISRTMSNYREEVKRKARELEEKRQVELRRQQEERERQERERQEKQDRIDREHREAVARAEAEAEAKRKAKAKEEEDARIKAAEAADEAGAGEERVDAILEKSTPQTPEVEPVAEVPKPEPVAELPPMPAPPPPVKVVIPTSNKASDRTKWEAQVEDREKLLKGVVAGLIPWDAIEIKQGFLNTKARKLKDKLDYPGVKAVPVADTTFKG